MARFQTGHRGKGSFDSAQDLSRRIFFRCLDKLIAALGAASALDQFGSGEGSNDLLQIFLGDFLSFGYTAVGNKVFLAIHGKIQHETQGIPTFC